MVSVVREHRTNMHTLKHTHVHTHKKGGREKMLRVNEMDYGDNLNEMGIPKSEWVRQGAPVDV